MVDSNKDSKRSPANIGDDVVNMEDEFCNVVKDENVSKVVALVERVNVNYRNAEGVQ